MARSQYIEPVPSEASYQLFDPLTHVLRTAAGGEGTIQDNFSKSEVG